MEPRQGELIMQGYVFDILNALDGTFAKHGALINKKYPPCPVCGREGLEPYDICTVCGWVEVELF